MLDKLIKHHLGFIVSLDQKSEIERRFGKTFTYDFVQGAHVLFVNDFWLQLYIEYICQEGRVKNHKPGYAHTCYQVNSKVQLAEIEDYIREARLGFQVTRLEKSASKECGYVVFYYLKNVGMIEFNLNEVN